MVSLVLFLHLVLAFLSLRLSLCFLFIFYNKAGFNSPAKLVSRPGLGGAPSLSAVPIVFVFFRPVWPLGIALRPWTAELQKKNLPDTEGTVIREAVLSR